ncbi:MAG TPA: aspartate kinase [Armatimonadota bacterium]|nr:aspartate kinase [Armatimonadota bacterium]
MRVVVQKFGGKCVEPGGNEMVTAERIMEVRDMGDYPVVVVSAMGRELRDKTEEIEELLRKPEGARKLALAHFYSTAELVRLVREIDPMIEPRELDMLMSCGEIISTVRLAHLLKSKGYTTIALTGGQVGLFTDGFFGHARVIETEIQQLIQCLDRPAIPFVTGFQGISHTDHAITTLGEGGSDYTAICLAYALKNTERTPLQEPIELGPVEIFKEVDGVMTANPANFSADAISSGSGPRMIRHLTFDELCSMSQYGADVIQAESARMARRYDLNIVVRNFRKPEDPGTAISSDGPGKTNRLVTGIADMPSMAVFTVANSNDRQNRRIAELLAQTRLNYQVVPVRDGSCKFGVKREKYRNVSEVVSVMLNERGIHPTFEEGQWALVTMVGEGMRGQVDEIAPRVKDILAGQKIQVEGEINDTLSYSVLVNESQRKESILALHDAFVTTTMTTESSLS